MCVGLSLGSSVLTFKKLFIKVFTQRSVHHKCRADEFSQTEYTELKLTNIFLKKQSITSS